MRADFPKGPRSLAALLVAGIAITMLVDRILGLREVARIKERLAADLNDEIGANLHTIGMLSDLAEDARTDPDQLSMLHGRIRSMTERSGTTVVTHINHIYEKLNVTNAPAAVNKAHHAGLFPLRE